MNLHGIVSRAVGVVNPLVPVTLQSGRGYTTGRDGTRTSTYAATQTVLAQVQQLTSRDLDLLDGLNVSGNLRALYVPGAWRGEDRPSQDGGDVVTLADGSVWLTVQVLELWPDWSKIAIVQQES